MTVPRFLVRAPLAAGQRVALPEAASHHALRVLRLRADDPIRLFDGAGNEFEARLQPAPGNATHSHALITSGGPVDREARVAVTLVQALAAQEKIDWVVEKCVELGAARLLLAPAARSVARLEPARRARRAERLRDIAAAACAQCGRTRLPEVEVLDDLGAALRRAQDATRRWVLDPAATVGLTPGGGSAVSLAVGPEGGFTGAELALAESLGYARLRLGPRVLRTETAGVAALSAVLALAGEFGTQCPSGP